jgi:hypothetical protein
LSPGLGGLVDKLPRHILDRILRQSGAKTAEQLNRLIKRYPPYANANAASLGAEILFDRMVEFYGTQGLTSPPSAVAVDDAPTAGVSFEAESSAQSQRQTIECQTMDPKAHYS